MTTLADIKDQLSENKQATEDTTSAIDALRQSFDLSLVMTSSNRLEDLENQRELINKISSSGGGGGGGDGRGGQDDSSGRKGLFSGLFAQLSAMSIRFTAPIASLFAPLTGLLKVITGPVGRVIGLLYAVFHDIGENALFASTLESIKNIWNNSILPTFQSIEQSLNNLAGGDFFADAGVLLESIRIKIQDFVLQSIEDLVIALDGVFTGFDQILKGEWIQGISTIVNSVLIFMQDIADNALTGILELFGADFGENGSLLTWMDAKWVEVTDGIYKLWETLYTTISDGFSTFAGFFTEYIPAKFTELKDSAVNLLTTTWNDWGQPLVDSIVSIISFVTDNFGLMVDIVKASFDYNLTMVSNGLQKAFTNVMAFINSIGDRLYLLIAENLRFSIPAIEIPKPEWLGGGSFTLIDGFSVGVGDAGIAQSRANIQSIEADRSATINRLDVETSSKLNDLLAKQQELKNNFTQNIIMSGGGTGGGGGSAVPIPVPAVPAYTVDLMDGGGRRYGPQ